jgi:hypothetical protein
VSRRLEPAGQYLTKLGYTRPHPAAVGQQEFAAKEDTNDRGFLMIGHSPNTRPRPSGVRSSLSAPSKTSEGAIGKRKWLFMKRFN